MKIPDTTTALRAVLPYAENEAFALQELADSEIAQREAANAWQAVELAQFALESGADLLDLLCRALPFVEDAEHDPCYKPGIARALAKQIRAVIEQTEN